MYGVPGIQSVPKAVNQPSIYQLIGEVDQPDLPARQYDLVPMFPGRGDLFFVYAASSREGGKMKHWREPSSSYSVRVVNLPVLEGRATSSRQRTDKRMYLAEQCEKRAIPYHRDALFIPMETWRVAK